jgi:hypothetical protein
VVAVAKVKAVVVAVAAVPPVAVVKVVHADLLEDKDRGVSSLNRA